jgi:long-chain acyl-CoA synthetase
MADAKMMKYLVQVEEAREAAPEEGGAPSAGPAYRCAAGGGGASPPAVPGLECCWDIFRYGRSIRFYF